MSDVPILGVYGALRENLPGKVGWLEVSPIFLAKFFGLEGTGRARFDLATGHILVEVKDAKIPADGARLTGLITEFVRLLVPSGWKVTGPGEGQR